MSSSTPSIGNSAAVDLGQALDPKDPPANGSFGSRPVTADNDSTPDLMSMLEKAAEETSIVIAEHQHTELDAREVEVPDDELQLGIDKIEELMRLLDGQESGDATSTQQLIKAADDDLNLLESAKKLATDPSKQFLLLAHALHTAKSQGQGIVAERLRDALARMERIHGATVWAGLNIAEVATKFGPTPKDASTFRAVYRDAVLGKSTAAETFKMVFERFGEARFKSGTALLIQALGADLAAKRPSMDKVHLHAILQDLYQLQAANTLIEITQRMAVGLAVHAVQISAVMLTQALADLAAKPSVSAWDIEDMSRRFVTRSAIPAA